MRTSSIKIEQLKLNHFKDYIDNGKYLKWFENGLKFHEKEYKNGKLHGKSLRWYVNGQKIWEDEYKNGVLHGKSLGWFENGRKRLESEFQNGVLKNMITYEKVENNHANN